jgi:hypothetical protein
MHPPGQRDCAIGGGTMRITKIPADTKAEAMAWIRAHKLTGLGILQLFHDDECKALHTQQDADCTPPCVPDVYLVEPFAASPAEAKAGLN